MDIKVGDKISFYETDLVLIGTAYLREGTILKIKNGLFVTKYLVKVAYYGQWVNKSKILKVL